MRASRSRGTETACCANRRRDSRVAKSPYFSTLTYVSKVMECKEVWRFGTRNHQSRFTRHCTDKEILQPDTPCPEPDTPAFDLFLQVEKGFTGF